MAAVANGLKRPYDNFMNGSSPFEPEASFTNSHLLPRGSIEHPFIPSSTPRSHPPASTTSELLQSESNSRIGSPSPYQRLPNPTPFRGSRNFLPHASLLIIGIRGTGKSSLAIIASKALRRQVIDADEYFSRFSGSSRTDFRRQHGATTYRKQEAQVMHNLLSRYGNGHVIACGPFSSVDGNGDDPLKEFAKTHPVIYLVRDPESVGSYLGVGDDEKIRRLLDICGPFYRASSNFEFYNLSEIANRHLRSVSSGTVIHSSRISPVTTPFLTLKDVEQDFLRVLRHINRGETTSLHADVTFPLSSIPLEARDYTYAVTAPLSRLLNEDLDIEELGVGADAFEIAIDTVAGSSLLTTRFVDNISRQIARVRRHTLVPIIYHVDIGIFKHMRSAATGDESDIPKDYLELVHHGLRLACDYVTVDLSVGDKDIGEMIASRGFSKIIGHAHYDERSSFDWASDTPRKMYTRARELGCDVVRLSKAASTMSDNFTVQRFAHHLEMQAQDGSRPPIIAYNTGSVGRLSSCFNLLLTPVTHPSLRAPQAMGSPHSTVTVAEAQEALFKSFVLDNLQFYIFGGNITHSLSPVMHNAAFEACGMPHHYSIIQAPSLRPLLELIERSDFGGCSVGLPYKLEVVSIVSSLSSSAKAIGAINTLVPIREGSDEHQSADTISCGRNRSGKVKALHGHNTDWIGIMNTVLSGLSPVNAVGPKTTGLIIGAGGMARASVYSMIQLGVKNIFIWNRTLENAQRIATHYNNQVGEKFADGIPTTSIDHAEHPSVTVLTSLSDPWPQGYKQPTMLVCTLPSASTPYRPAPNFTMPEQWLQSATGGVVVELTYQPLVTTLMRQMRDGKYYTRGWVFMDGLDVLPQQGFAQFEVFTGRRAPRRLMQATVLRAFATIQGSVEDEAGVNQRLEDIESPAAV